MRRYIVTEHIQRSPSSIGIDISDDSVKLVRAVARDNYIKITEHANAPLLFGCVKNGVAYDIPALSRALSDLLSRLKLNLTGECVVMAIPDNQVVIKQLEYHATDQEQSYNYLNSYVRQYVSQSGLPINDPVIRWTFVKMPTGKKNIVVRIVEKDFILPWLKFANDQGFRLVELENRGLANARALVSPTADAHSVAIIDLDINSSSANFFSKGSLVHSATAQTGIAHLISFMASLLHVPIERARDILVETGLGNSGHENLQMTVRRGLSKILDALDLPTLLNLCATTDVIITGRGALIPGIHALISSNYNLSAKPDLPWLLRHQALATNGNTVFGEQEYPVYSGALGVALKKIFIHPTITDSINFLD